MRGKFVKAIDMALAGALPGARLGGRDLVIYAFHSVLPGLEALGENLIDPYQPITLADIESVIVALKPRGLRFVTGHEITAGERRGPMAWLTFDDGYANNLALLPLLRRHGVPATIFVATGHVMSGEAYWWDVLYREGMRRGRAPGDLAREREAMKALAPAQIRARLIAMFGEGALRPVGEIDRPMHPEELARLAREPLIEIGNHTHAHSILTRIDNEAARREIAACSKALARITGRAPASIAYPNGNFSPAVVEAARSAGLEIGVTCLPFRNRIAGGGAEEVANLALGRFAGLRNGVIGREITLSLAPLGLAMARSERLAQGIVRTPFIRPA